MTAQSDKRFLSYLPYRLKKVRKMRNCVKRKNVTKLEFCVDFVLEIKPITWKSSKFGRPASLFWPPPPPVYSAHESSYLGFQIPVKFLNLIYLWPRAYSFPVFLEKLISSPPQGWEVLCRICSLDFFGF